uniref:Uncharacterized protein n=1 Tax=Nelumbo nucifera TaxID=4432 RepID=A0A822YFQ2_NELNU|nr:TPA_asm: hypothetical protein HUJ06_031284 [Nelumbo nucifera]
MSSLSYQFSLFLTNYKNYVSLLKGTDLLFQERVFAREIIFFVQKQRNGPSLWITSSVLPIHAFFSPVTLFSHSPVRFAKPQTLLNVRTQIAGRMVERFFFLSTKQQIEKEKECNNSQMMLLSGPPSCGKTSLFFRFAINSAFRASPLTYPRYSTFITTLFGIDATSDVFNLIRINQSKPVRTTFTALHWEYLPPYVLYFMDRYSQCKVTRGYCNGVSTVWIHTSTCRNCKERLGNPRGRDLAMVRTLALCRDALAHAK